MPNVYDATKGPDGFSVEARAADEFARLEGQADDTAADPPPPPPVDDGPVLREKAIAVSKDMLFASFFAVAPNWKMTRGESDALVDAYVAVLDKHFPDWFRWVSVELNAVLITIAIIGPRASIPRVMPKEAPPEPAPAAEGPTVGS
ncbi:MAG: hypothetical protein ACYCOR_19200 [Acidobacteriaceae bacterium]